MLRTISSIDKSVVAVPFAPVVVAAATTTPILTDITGQPGEYASRLIQNVGNNPILISVGTNASADQYNVSLPSGQQLDCTGQSISGYSILGTTVAILVLARKDNTQSPNTL